MRRKADQERVKSMLSNLITFVANGDKEASARAKARADARRQRYGQSYDRLDTATLRPAPKGAQPYRVNPYQLMTRRQYRLLNRLAAKNGVSVDEMLRKLGEAFGKAVEEANSRVKTD